MENPFVNYQKIIHETASNHFNVADEFKNNTVEDNIEICNRDRLPFSVGAINIAGDLNIGMMIRSACLMGASNFYIFGRKRFDKRSTVGAEKYMNIVQYNYEAPLHADELILHDLLKLKHPIFACEQGGLELGSPRCIIEYHRVSNMHPLFLFGSESHGIPEVILNRKTTGVVPVEYQFTRISIPQRGVLRSFNVSAAMNIVIWDYLKETML
jgi:tRNA G18 (ribose-2'-O)-methylase SpoU